jgi:hypothetical protein
LQDEAGAPVVPESITYSIDGEISEYTAEQLGDPGFLIGGSQAGTYHIWVTVGDQQWESEDIDVVMGGPENCRLPETVDVTVTFAQDAISDETLVSGSTCG